MYYNKNKYILKGAKLKTWLSVYRNETRTGAVIDVLNNMLVDFVDLIIEMPMATAVVIGVVGNLIYYHYLPS
jgi:hypothetical protein